MKLTKISFTNFKGASASYDLAAINCIVGRNFRGKTRITDAIRLALLGYLPELGKNNRATFGLSSGPEMEVRADFDDGQAIRRRFYLKGDTVKADEDVPEGFDQSGDLLVMMDAETYFGMSDAARVAYVAAHCPAPANPDWEDVAIQQRVLKFLMTDREKEAVDRFVAAVSAQTTGQSFGTAQEFIAGQIIAVQSVAKSARDHATRMEKTIQGMSGLRAEDAPSASMTFLESRRSTISAEITIIQEKRAGLLARFTAMKSANARRIEIDRDIRFGDKTRQEHVDLTAKFELIRQKLSNAQNPEAVDAMALEQQIGDLNSARAVLDSRQLQAYRDKVVALKEMDDVDQQDKCPYCGAEGDGWKALKTAELATLIDARAQAWADLEGEKAQLDAKLLGLCEQLKVARDSAKAVTDLQGQERALEQRIASLATSLARLEGLAGERDRLAPDDPQLTTDVELLQTELNIKNDDLRRVEGQIKEAMGRQHELERLAEAEQQRDQSKVDQETAKAAEKELRAIQGELVEAAFKPLLIRANSFFATVLQSPLAYHAGEIGTWRDGQFVGHRTFSGTEKALTYAAIQAALSMSSPFKLMIIDELGRLDVISIDRLINGVCKAAAAGLIDGFIGIDTSRGTFYKDHAGAFDDSAFQVLEIQ